MNCSKCNTKLNGNENYCPNCGIEIKKQNNPKPQVSNGKKTASIVLGIISLVGIFLLIFSPISFILSLIGLIIGIIANKEVSNVPGIVLNAISLFLSLIVTAIIAVIVMIIINVRKNVDARDNHNFDLGDISSFDFSDIPNFNLEDFPWNEIFNEFNKENKF